MRCPCSAATSWEIEELWVPDETPGTCRLRGWLVNTTFRRPDCHTGEVGTGRGRLELITRGATLSAAVKTAWLLAELIVRHELMEAFLFDDKRVFDPHKTVGELTG